MLTMVYQGCSCSCSFLGHICVIVSRRVGLVVLLVVLLGGFLLLVALDIMCIMHTYAPLLFLFWHGHTPIMLVC